MTKISTKVQCSDNMQIPQVKILVLADIHGYTKKIPLLTEAAKACDVILLAGDITDFGSKAQAQSVLEALNELGRPVLGVSGNCDPPEAEEVLRQQGVCLVDHPVEKKGVVFIGFPCPASRESILPVEQYLAAHPQPFVLVSHQPAGETAVDLQGGSRHKGNQFIRSFIEDYQPLAAVSGHIHEARGTDQIGSTLLINPGPFRNDCYAVIEIGADSIQAKLYSL
ncbi:MAG: metallophosphoesterase family protein [Planctomycetota bacterium]